MLENIIVILLVIGLSYLFRQNSNDTFNTQMLFILLSLGGIIFYKIIYLQHYVNNKEMFVVDREPFQNNLNSVLSTFTKGSHASNSNEQHNTHAEKISNLESTVVELKDSLDASKKERDSTGDNYIDTSTMESLRMSELRNLERDIDELTKTAVNQNKKVYKKIPVYNSCIIKEADGSSSSTPVNSGNTIQKQPYSNGIITEEDIEEQEKKLKQYQGILNTFKDKITSAFNVSGDIKLDLDN